MAKVTQAHINARTEDILHAAIRLFAQRGAERTTMAEIAAEAGISAGAIYRYFPGKEDLLGAVFEHAHQENHELFAGARADTGGPLEALLTAGNRFLDGSGGEQCQVWLEVILASARDPEGFGQRHRAVHDEVVGMIGALVSAAQASGEMRTDVAVHDITTVLAAVAVGLQIMLLETNQEIDTRAALAALGTLLRADVPALAPRLVY